MPGVLTQYRLPDILADWPWLRCLSPYYDEAKAESTAWVESFTPFQPKEQAAFNRCDFNLLACLTYPLRSKEFTRVACDLMNFYFVYDEYTDIADGEAASQMANLVMDALRNPNSPRPADDMIGEITRQLWQRALSLTEENAPCIQHFISGFDEYIKAVAQEADDRVNNRLRTVEDYLRLRRGTTSMTAIFALIEFGLDLPNEVLNHPTVVRLTDVAAELCGITNDLHSYALEHARGLDGHNMVSAIMHEHALDLQGALDWLGEYVKGLVSQFLEDLKVLPTYDEDTDGKLKIYVDGLGQWVRGNEHWCYESKRYYGDDGAKVKETHLITLRSPERGYLKEEQSRRPAKGT